MVLSSTLVPLLDAILRPLLKSPLTPPLPLDFIDSLSGLVFDDLLDPFTVKASFNFLPGGIHRIDPEIVPRG